jgi:hypothetical protein
MQKAKRSAVALKADIGSPVWAKSDAMGPSAKAHLWQRKKNIDGWSSGAASWSSSACGMLYRTTSLVVAREHTAICRRCEKDEK